MTTSGPVTTTGIDRAAASALRDAPGRARPGADGPSEAGPSSAGPAAIVDLSGAAKAAAQGTSDKTDFAAVAKDARAALDAGYGKAGKTASIYTTGAEWHDLFGGLDRRSLFAIKSNAGKQFTALEQDMAKTEMQARMDAATGQSNVVFASDNPPQLWKNAVQYLDGASDEEKGSFEWAKQRAAVQSNYELTSRASGQEPETLDSTDPIVKMLKAAFDSLKELSDPSKTVEDMPLYKQAEQRFLGGQGGSSSAVDITA